MYVSKAQQQGALRVRAFGAFRRCRAWARLLWGPSAPPPFRDFREFRDLRSAMAKAGHKRVVNKMTTTQDNPGWLTAVIHTLLYVILCNCIFCRHIRLDCQTTACFPWSMHFYQDLCYDSSGSCLDTPGTVSRTRRSRRLASTGLEMHTSMRVMCAPAIGRLPSHAPACDHLSGSLLAARTEQHTVLPDRIAPQSVTKTFFQLQAKLEPMSLEERGRTGLTSKATGNPFAFTERPANGTSPLNCFSFGPQLFTGPMERWRLWRLWTDLPAVTTCAHSIIKGSSHQSPSGWRLAHSTNCELLCDAAALPLPRHCTVVCRQQRLHHTAGAEHDCPASISSSHPWHRLETTSPGANPSSAKPPLTACLDTQVLNRLEVSSPEPYSLSQEMVSMSLDLSQVATLSVLCLHLHSDDLSCILSCESIFCGARWIVAHNTACTPPPSTAVSSQIWFRHCPSLYLTTRSWPSVLPRASRLLGPLPKLDPSPDQVPLAPTPTKTTAPRNMFTLLFLRLPALPRLLATHLLPQRRYRRLRGPRFFPARRPRPRQSSHHIRFQVLHRRTRRVLPPAPMLRCPATGLTRSWGGGGGGGVHVYFPPYTATPALPHIAGYEHTFTLSSRAIPPKAATPKATPPRPPRRTD